MTIESGSKPTGQDIRGERIRQLADLDARILEVMAERTALLARESSWRRKLGKGGVDPALEKSLWQAFQAKAKEAGLDPQLARQLFNLLNLAGTEETKPQKTRAQAFVLAPRREPVDLALPGPRSLVMARTWVCLAAAANLPLTLTPVILNDPLIELVKALNQAGARLSWAQDTITQDREGNGLDFEGKTLFVGDDSFNFYLLTAMSLAHAGRVKFTGGPGLKLMDTALLNVILPKLGARLVPLNPHSHGLPARLECGGEMEPSIELPAEVPPEFAAALALAAWNYPQGLRLSFQPGAGIRKALAAVVWTLHAAGIEARLEDNLCVVPAGIPGIPPDLDPPLDPVLSAYLLALPAVADGRVELSGAFHAEDPCAEFILKRLEALGLDLIVTQDRIVSKALRHPEQEIKLGREPQLMPLALALALKAKRPVCMQLPKDPEMAGLGEEFLARLGADFEYKGECIEVRPSTLSWREPWTCPTPHFALGLALAAFVRSGLSLDNPGVLTSLWPQFFGLYNALPTGRPTRPDKDDKENGDGPRRRRVKL